MEEREGMIGAWLLVGARIQIGTRTLLRVGFADDAWRRLDKTQE